MYVDVCVLKLERKNVTPPFSVRSGSLNGEQKSNREWQRQHETELCSNKYKDIDNRYRFAMVEAETECMAIRVGNWQLSYCSVCSIKKKPLY